MRILHTESSIGWGGQEIRILTEAQGMLARGHEVTLLTASSAEIFPAAQRRHMSVIALPIEKKRPSAFLALRSWLAAHRSEFDVINTHSSTDSWLTALACKSLHGAPPMVRTRHVSTKIHNNRGTRWLYQSAAAHIVTTGEALREQLVRENGFAAARITSVPTGIDLARFVPMDRGRCRAELAMEDRPTVGIVATLRDWKGHDDLLDAWKLLGAEFPEWRLLVVGDGPQRARLEARVASEGLAGRVRFAGNQDNVPRWLNGFDLFTLPSFGDEGVPQAIMQAMACGLAVVATSVGAIEEAVQRDRTGLIVPPRNPRALAEALGRLMADPARRSAMGAAGRERALAHFGIDRMLDKMHDVFRRVIEHR